MMNKKKMKLSRSVLLLCSFLCPFFALDSAFANDDLLNVAKIAFDVDYKSNEKNLAQSVTNKIADKVLGVNGEDWSEILSVTKDISQSDLDLINAYIRLGAIPYSSDLKNDDYDLLLKFKDSPNWIESHMSNFLLSAYHLKQNGTEKGLFYAYKSLTVIPADMPSQEVINAQFETYGLINIGLIIEGHSEQVIDTVNTYLELALRANRDIDAFSIVNNLAVLSSRSGNFDIANKLMSISSNHLSFATEEQLRLHYYSTGRFLVLSKRFKDALPPLNKALDLHGGERFQAHIYRQLATVYGQVGSLEELQRFISLYEVELKNIVVTPQQNAALLRLKVRAAEIQNDFKKAYTVQSELSDLELRIANDTISASRLQTAEKIAVAKEELSNAINENNLKDIIIKREKRIRLTSIYLLIFILVTALLSLGLFLRERFNSKRYLIARDKALAGEIAKTEFLSVMSHEFRTPLNAIIPISEMLSNQLKGTSQAKLVGIIDKSGKSLLGLIENVLTVSSGAGDYVSRYVESNPSSALQELLSNYVDVAANKNISLTAKTKGDFDNKIEYDGRSFDIVVNNLVSNAIKFTDKGYVKVLLTCDHSTKTLGFIIADSGSGIDVDKVENFKKAFTQDDMSLTRKAEGMGIGLAAVDTVLSKIGGSIRFTNNNIGGTTVYVVMPFGNADESAFVFLNAA